MATNAGPEYRGWQVEQQKKPLPATMGLAYEPVWRERLMARRTTAPRVTPRPRTLRDSLRNFLTPALGKQAHRADPRRRRPPRWAAQPLVLVLLCLTLAAGDST